MKKAYVFGFVAKLQKPDAKDRSDYFIMPFKVAAATHDSALNKLKEYLNRPEQTKYKYSKCVEIIDTSADIILADDDINFS